MPCGLLGWHELVPVLQLQFLCNLPGFRETVVNKAVDTRVPAKYVDRVPVFGARNSAVRARSARAKRPLLSPPAGHSSPHWVRLFPVHCAIGRGAIGSTWENRVVLGGLGGRQMAGAVLSPLIGIRVSAWPQ